MVRTYLQPVAARWALACLTGAAVAGACLPGRAGEKQPVAGDPTAFVERRLREWRPTAAERRFDTIGWAPDIRTAERLAKEHNRPVFLFTHDGRMAVGRC